MNQTQAKYSLETYETKHKKSLFRSKILFSTAKQLWTASTNPDHPQPSLPLLIAANPELVHPHYHPKPATTTFSRSKRARHPDILAYEKYYDVRIYGSGVKLLCAASTFTPAHWQCRSLDDLTFVYAPSLADLVHQAPHIVKPNPPPKRKPGMGRPEVFKPYEQRVDKRRRT